MSETNETKRITLDNGIEVNQRTRKSMFKVDPREIIFDPDKNPRKFYGTTSDWNAHKESIRQNGVKESIKIQNTREGTILVHGFRRMKAVMELIAEGVDIKSVPCEVVPVGYTEEQILMDHLILNSGLSLTPLEEASVYQQFIDYGWTQKQIAEKTGKTQGAISNILKLSNLPMRVQNYINDGKVSSSMVMHLIKDYKNDYKAVERKLTSFLETSDSKTKATEKTMMIKRVSKYHKLFTGSIEHMRSNNVSEERISKVEAIMNALDVETPEALADAILAVL